MTADPMGPQGSPRFLTTRWSMVVAAGDSDDSGGPEALEDLCREYWFPLYAFERRRGTPPADAQDLVQSFFAEAIEKDYVKQANRERGRFRTFLIASFRHHASKEREKGRAQKRGGGRAPLPLDFADGESRVLLEPADDRTPERVFERRWALALLDRVMARLRAEEASAGRGDLFDGLRPYLAGEGGPPHAETAARLGMSEGAVKVAVHRLRRRYRDALREAIAETVADAAEVDDEIRHLLAALAY